MKLILLILAIVAFLLAVCGATWPHIPFVPVGLALFAASFLPFSKSP
jgi:uncharacterized protein YqgC (DUF456 family)